MHKKSFKRVDLLEFIRRIIIKNELTSEMLEKLKAAKSVFELLSIAKENGTELTQEDAEAYYTRLNQNGVLPDDEFNQVTGGILTSTSMTINIKYSTAVCGKLRCPYRSPDSTWRYDSISIKYHIQREHPEKYSEYFGDL